MKNLIWVLMIIMSFSSLAQTQNFIAEGRVHGTRFNFGPFHNVRTINVISLKTKMYVNEYSEGKIKGKVTIKITKQCKGLASFEFFGMDNGMGEYELFATTEDLIQGEKSIGVYTDFGREISIDLKKGFKYSSKYRGLDCLVSINPSSGIVLEKK